VSVEVGLITEVGLIKCLDTKYNCSHWEWRTLGVMDPGVADPESGGQLSALVHLHNLSQFSYVAPLRNCTQIMKWHLHMKILWNYCC